MPFQSTIDRSVGKLIESFNMEYLNDALWKASRFPLESKIIDPVSNDVSSIIDQIRLMKKYVQKSMNYFKNLDILKRMDYLIENGIEFDEQIQVFDDRGMNGLKTSLMDFVEYN